MELTNYRTQTKISHLHFAQLLVRSGKSCNSSNLSQLVKISHLNIAEVKFQVMTRALLKPYLALEPFKLCYQKVMIGHGQDFQKYVTASKHFSETGW